MNKIYTPQLEQQLRRTVILWGVVCVGAAVALAAAAVMSIWLAGGLTLPVTLVMGIATAVTGLSVYNVYQSRLLPLVRTHQQMKRLEQLPAEDVCGTFQGIPQAKSICGGILTHKLQLDEGKQVRQEAVFRELSIPAVFELPQLEKGQLLQVRQAEGMVISAQLPQPLKLNPLHGRYRMVGAVVLSIVAAAAMIWGVPYAAIHRQSGENTLQVAVCTPAHHLETGLEVEKRMAQDSLHLCVSYTNTIENEAVATYLSTFGALEADILILNTQHFENLFENEGSVLPQQDITQALGFAPRFLTDASHNPTGVLLYDPEDPAYSANFPRLIDWIAVEKSVPLAVTIRSNSVHADTGAANLALVQLLCFLAGK